MSKFRYLQSNFNAGELSAKMEGRTDLQEYINGLSQMYNFIPMKQGGATKRPGTLFVREITGLGASDANGGPAALPFIVSKTEAYAIVIKNDGTANASNFMKIVRNDGGGTFATISPDGLNNSILATINPKEYVFAQANDVLFVTHTSGLIRPFVIYRKGSNSFGVADYERATEIFGLPSDPLRHPYRDPNITATTLSFSATTGSVTVTSSTPIFDIGQVNSKWKVSHGSNTGSFTITGFTSSTQVTATVTSTLGGTAGTTDWQEGAWSVYRGWPKSVAIYEERLFWGGNEAEKDKVWASASKNFFHMMQLRFKQDQGSSTDVSGNNYFGDIAPTDPFNIIYGSTDTNAVTYLASGNSLFTGTLGAEYISDGGDNIFSLESAFVKKQTNYGSKPAKVANVNNEIVYITRDGRGVRNFRFSRENGSFISANLSKIADHIHRQGTKDVRDIYNTSIEEFDDIIYQQSRETMWVTTTNNEIVALTFSREDPILAWSRHSIGGADTNIWGTTVIPNSDGIFDNLYMVVGRTINGVTKYYLEFMKNDWDLDSLLDTSAVVDNLPVWVDCAVIRNVGVGTQFLTGLSHLEGETVAVTRNGTEYTGDFTVSGGQIDLGSVTTEASRFIIGFKYDAILDTMRIEAGLERGDTTSKGAIQRIDRADLLLYKTADVSVGTAKDSGFLETINFIDVFTGTKRVNVTMSPDIDNKLRIKSSKPFPCTILGIVMRGVTND